MLALVLVPVSGVKMCSRAKPNASSRLTTQKTSSTSLITATNVKFDTRVRPMLESRCKPCHFPGGVMYQRLPFDRAETITSLGTKLFTRIQDENERQVIRDFLSQP
jgi:hypothetical protein